MRLCWDCFEQTDWDGFAPLSLQQSWAYGAAAGCARRVRIETEGLRGQAQVLSRGGRFGGMALISRGPIWDGAVSADVQRETLQMIRRDLQGITMLLTTPESGAAGLPLMTSATVAEVDLSADSTAMRAALQGKWRNRLVKAEASGLELRISRPNNAALRRFAMLDHAQQRQKGFRALGFGFLDGWRGHHGEMQLLIAHAAGNMVAAVLILRHGAVATYQFGWSSTKGRRLNAHNLLLWTAMEQLGRAGCQRLDLGMLDTVNAPGLAHFKLGTGAVARQLGSTGLVLPRLRAGWATRAQSPGRRSAPQR